MARIVALFLLVFFCFTPASVIGFEQDTPNNKFGIHLASPHESDLKRAAELVNSSGGSWGYVTLVLQENDRDHNKWQDILDRCREFKLIPIIRLATSPIGDKWRKPNVEDATKWVDFLNSLNWIVRDRYVILFNEPNHGAEWGGEVNPESYGEIAEVFAKKLKEKNKDFFVMLAGFDSAAPSAPPNYEDEIVYLSKVVASRPNIFNYIDGWASHSYPNPGFAGSPYDTGRNSIRNYEWELELLRNLGASGDWPVFITETGWPHSAGNFYSSDVAGAFTEIAYRNAWLTDPKVRAVTPFILNYQGEPFSAFSWTKPGEKEFYPNFAIVQAIAKERGEPSQIERGSFGFSKPKELLVGSSYHFKIKLKNTGQSIWDSADSYKLKLTGIDDEYLFTDLKNIKPRQEGIVDLFLKTGDKIGRHKAHIALYKNDKEVIDITDWTFTKLPLPQLEFNVNLSLKIKDQGNDFEIQIFDIDNQLIFKKKGLTVQYKKGTLDGVQNVVLGQEYRVVILKPYYLPRQTFTIFKKGKNYIHFKLMLPMDFDRDGNFDVQDILTLFKNPKLFGVFLP